MLVQQPPEMSDRQELRGVSCQLSYDRVAMVSATSVAAGVATHAYKHVLMATSECRQRSLLVEFGIRSFNYGSLSSWILRVQ